MSSRFACRGVLAEALGTEGPLAADLQRHVDACEFCRARLAARDRLAPLLRRVPPMPAVSREAMLADVHERVVERAENGPIGELVARAVPTPAGLDAEAWPNALLESSVARQQVAAPASPGDIAWSRVRSTILDRIGEGASVAASPRRGRNHWWVGVLGTAAAAVIVLAVVRQDSSEPPRIVIQDIRQLPASGSLLGVDFAVVRHGATR